MNIINKYLTLKIMIMFIILVIASSQASLKNDLRLNEENNNISNNNKEPLINGTSSLLFTNNKELECQSDHDCKDMFICENNNCIHKPALPISFTEILTYLLLSVSFGISILCGIGGGGIFTATIMWLENFSTSEAVPLSVSIMFISAVMTFYMNSQFKTQNPDTDFVNYKMVILLMPMILIGAKFGALINSILPFIVTSTMLLCFSIFVFRNNYYKYIKISNEESNKKEKLENNMSFKTKLVTEEFKDEIHKGQELIKRYSQISRKSKTSHDIEMDTLEPGYLSKETAKEDTKNDNAPLSIFQNLTNITSTPINEDNNYISESNQDELSKILIEENKAIPWKYFKLLLITECIVILDIILEGNKNVKSIIGISHCSFFYWALFFLVIVGLYFLIHYFIIFLTKEYEYKQSLDKKYRDENLEFLLESTDKIMFYGFITGVLSGTLGIGGGLVLTPIMLSWGLSPKQTTSSSNVLIVFSSFTSSIMFVMMGNLYIDYAIIISLPCIISCYICSNYINEYIKRTGKQSILIWILNLLVILSIIFLIISMKNKIEYSRENHTEMVEFGNICSN